MRKFFAMRKSKAKEQNSRKPSRSKLDRNGPVSSKKERRSCNSSTSATLVPLFLVIVGSVALHVHIALDRNNWWQLHADEVYQTLEVAHIELYGYGFLPYEFGGIPPPNDTSSSVLEKANAERGMYAMRSAIIPKIFKIAIQFGSWMSTNTPPYQIAKVFHSAWTGLLPGSVFLFALVFFRRKPVALLAASLVALSEPLLVLGTHTLINSLISPLLFTTLAVIKSMIDHVLEIENAEDTLKSNKPIMEKSDDSVKSSISVADHCNVCNVYVYMLWWLSLPVAGTIVGILCYIRIDVLLFAGILMAMIYCTKVPHLIFRFRAIFPVITSLGLSFITGFLLGGYSDRLFYGQWFITPVQWFRFNVHLDLATEIFGGHSWFMYVDRILVQDPVFLVFIITSVYGSMQLVSKEKSRTGLHLLACLILLLLVYSMKGHKEVRFLHDWIVLALIFCANGVYNISRPITDKLGHEKWHQIALLLSLLAVFAANSYYLFPSAKDGSNKRWTYKRSTDSGYVNLCLQWVGTQDDSTGVFVDHDVYGFGGYTVLRKRIPIIAKMNTEMREWNTVTKPRSVHLYTVNGFANATSFDDFRLWVTIQNVQRIVKYLLMTPLYNYVVVSTDRQFVEIGFNEVKRFGSVRVLQRDNSKQMKQRLYNMGNKMNYGRDPDILEMEGHTLYSSGFYAQALERLKAALQMDPNRVQLQDLVRVAESKLGHTT